MSVSHSRNLTAGTIEHGTILKGGMVLYRLCNSIEDYGRQTEAKFADAQLFAAADDLLEALQACNVELIGHAAYLETCDGGVILDNLENTVRHLRQVQQIAAAAIRKAKGE